VSDRISLTPLLPISLSRLVHRGTGQQPGLGILRGFVQQQKREQVRDLLRLELLLDAFGHQRDFALLGFFDFASGDGFQLSALDFEHDPLIAVLHDQTRKHPPIRSGHRQRAVVRPDD
jgi:hypothetical protein